MPAPAGASSASPPNVDFGSVPINTTATRSVTITVDSGYRTEVASGSGLNAPFSFDFSSCGTGGGFTGPGTCTVNESFHPTALTSSSGTTNVFECPVVGGTCIAIPFGVQGTGTQVTTTTTLTSSVNPSTIGQAVTFTATVTGTTAPSGGTVTFSDGAAPLATVGLTGGTASFTTSTLTLGSHTISAAYSGTGTFGPSTASLTQVVQRIATTTTLTSSKNPSIGTQPVTFTATVAPAAANGTVTFSDGATPLATVALTGGTATLTISTLATGAHTISAAYSGDGTFAPSSATLTQTVVTARSLKQSALATATTLLADAGTGNRKKLTAIVQSLTDSLNPSLWVDDNHLDRSHGKDVFASERAAADKLNDLSNQSLIDTLEQADQILATVAIGDAIAAHGDARKIADAQQLLAKAADAIAGSDFTGAINNYANAWQHAEDAMPAAGDPGL
jgi:hypothetical protein